MRPRSIVLVLALVVPLAAPGPLARAQGRAPLGTNLSEITDWVGEIPLADAFKSSRPWISGSSTAWDDGRPLDLDADGWVRSLAPGQIARTLMFTGQGNRYPAGRYVVRYDGTGTIRYTAGARIHERAPGIDVVDAGPARGHFGLELVATDPNDPVRNIRVRIPGAADGDLFHPAFLESLARYRAIRFMNWQLGQVRNQFGPVQRTWSDRPRPEHARYNGRGAPVEVMVALANALDVEPWFTIPHAADDNYVLAFAEVVRDRLEPGRKVYVEHSNEVWNGSFPQAAYCEQRGLDLGLGTTADRYAARMRYHARRTREIGRLFDRMLGADRVVVVLAMQAANSWWPEQLLGWDQTASEVDALAIAPYFGDSLGQPAEYDRVSRLDLDDLFLELETVGLPVARDRMIRQAAVAGKYGIPLLAYEGGQHLAGVQWVQNDPAINALFDAANRDPRMGRLYRLHLEDWNQAGGSLYAHFTHCDRFTKFGRYATLEWIGQPRSEAPKYDALQSYMEESFPE